MPFLYSAKVGVLKKCTWIYFLVVVRRGVNIPSPFDDLYRKLKVQLDYKILTREETVMSATDEADNRRQPFTSQKDKGMSLIPH